jgi:ABC-type multidrug transport system fused ATPase/permease subunit
MFADQARQKCATLLEDLRQVRSLGDFLPTSSSAGQSFNDRLRQCHDASLREHTSAAANGPTVLLFLLVGVWLILLLGGLNVLQDPPRVTVSGIVLLGTTLMAMAFPLRQLWQMSRVVPAADEAAADILAYLDRQPAVGQISNAQPLPRPTKQIALVNVTVANAAGDKLLNDVSLAIPCGGETALVASDDESLSALVGLLPRFYDPAAGRILFDGFDIGRATLASVRAEVAVLIPERILVTGSVLENITGGDPRFSLPEVTDAARRALAYDFVQRLPHGFDTIVGEHGQHLTVA